MICPKCSNECDSNLLFCPKCGYKINTFLKKDENLFSADDNNLDEMFVSLSGKQDEKLETFIDNNKSQKNKITTQMLLEDDFDDDFEDYIPPRKIVESRKAVNSRNATSKSTEKQNKNQHNQRKITQNKKKKSGKKVAIVIMVAVFAVALAVMLTFFVKKSSMNKNFKKYYNQGDVYFTQQNYKEAKTQFINAASNAFSDEQKIKSYEMIYKIDDILGNYVDEEIKYLELLIDLDNENIEYYKALIVLYQNNGKEDKIKSLINNAPSNVKQSLESFDGTIPVANVEEGSYDIPIKVQLSTMEGLAIYYTLSESGKGIIATDAEYSKPIKIEDEGNYILKAYSKSNSGAISKELTIRYNLNFNEVDAPQVGLDSGVYYDEQKITVTAENGATIYYTTTGVIPNSKSKKYKKPIELPKGDSIYYFVAIDKDGVSSNVVTRAYSYQPKFNVDYDTALNTLSLTLVSNGVLENKYGEFENGDFAYFEYTTVEEIEENSYYIITCEIESKQGSSKSTEIYAVSCDDGECFKAKTDGTGYMVEEL